MTVSDSASVETAMLRKYRGILARRRAVLLALVLVVAVCFVIDIATGPAMLSPLEVLRALAGQELGSGVNTIVFGIRLPAAILSILVGVALSLAGAEMQTLLDNPMASPFTLGLSSAATFGAALAIIVGTSLPFVDGEWFVFVNAFLMALLSAFLLRVLSRLYSHDTSAIVLFGIALLFAFNAMVAMIQFFASEQALQQLVFWTMGSLDRGDWNKILILAVTVLAMGFWSWRSVASMNALRLGRERAASLGLDMDRYSLGALVRVSLLTGISVAIVGVVGFIGLVGPHMARLLVGGEHRYLLPAAALSGAAIMSMASILSRMLLSGVVLPIGLVTALVGVPLFMVLILRNSGRN